MHLKEREKVLSKLKIQSANKCNDIYNIKENRKRGWLSLWQD